MQDAHSAYLRQHAHQDVDWWPFGPEALAEAERRDVPLFVSIGYAACHWCHVMAGESFDDPGIAEYLNEHFVPIKVDREEQPDVDELYMAATQTLSGQGGWPMSVFALPDGRTFHAGTYFPPRPVQGRPSFRMVLEGVNEAWRERRPLCEEQAARLSEHLGELADAQRDLLGLSAADAGPGRAGYDGAAGLHAAVLERLAADEHPEGGFSPAPKFPPSSVLDYLLELAGSEADAEQRELALGLASRTLDAMGHGALVDHVGGGFHRYCVDDAWRVPHFEKMLYDNAQLLRHAARWSVLCGLQAERLGRARSAHGAGPTHPGAVHPGAAHPDTASADAAHEDVWQRRSRFGRRLAEGAFEWLATELLLPGRAGLASSLDADTVEPDGRHVEGGTYLFSAEELRAAAGDHWERLADRLDGLDPEELAPTARAGHPDGRRTVAFDRPLDCEEWAAWDRAVPRLRRLRADRAQPARDDKVVAGWNGLAVRALAEAGLLLERPGMVDLAAGLADYLWGEHWDPAERTLRRVVYRPGSALLEDYAGVALGFQAVAVATGDERWIYRARQLVDTARARLRLDDAEHASDTADDALSHARGGRPGLSGLDDATPSGLALHATALVVQSGLDADPDRARRAEALTAHVRRIAPKAPPQFATALAAAVRLDGDRTLAVVGGTGEERRAAVRAAVVHGITAFAVQTPNDDVGLTAHRPAGTGGELRLYLCRGQVCDAPSGSVDELERALAADQWDRESPAGP
ncbi:thioredoxin domain-containing protein [Zhihengliuella alba]|uniref:Thioredoxin domain-containing protein n=1 Tax=Zhihengliuella alba TaxID=547018 RepID=A0ABP7DC40_9MICC